MIHQRARGAIPRRHRPLRPDLRLPLQRGATCPEPNNSISLPPAARSCLTYGDVAGGSEAAQSRAT
eukprot:950242-Pyramimonas_sp.AAC.1